MKTIKISFVKNKFIFLYIYHIFTISLQNEKEVAYYIGLIFNSPLFGLLRGNYAFRPYALHSLRNDYTFPSVQVSSSHHSGLYYNFHFIVYCVFLNDGFLFQNLPMQNKYNKDIYSSFTPDTLLTTHFFTGSSYND